MSAPDVGEELHARIERLTAERDAVAAETQELRAKLELARADRDERREARSRGIQRRRVWIGSAMSSIVGLSIAAYLFHRQVDSETLRGEVTAATDGAPARVGDACELRFEGRLVPRNAWMQVDCGRRRLYGHEGFGYLPCDLAGGRAGRCEDWGPIDRDADPHVVFDRSARRLVLDDGERWRIEVALSR